jgi:hypothetical protein
VRAIGESLEGSVEVSMNTPALEFSTKGSEVGDWRIIVDSIGEADASLLAALKRASPLPESHLATLLYQAPSVLAVGLAREAAEAVNEVLTRAGLESRVATAEESFEAGDAQHELALSVPKIELMPELLRLVMRVLGVDPPTARKMLCASPTVLLGRLSAASAGALSRRIGALGVKVIVSRTDQALYDIFLGECSAAERQRALQALSNLRVELASVAKDGAEAPASPLLAEGLPKTEADRLWQVMRRTSLPVRVINRDFQSFDLILEKAPAMAEMVDFLVATSGMPERVAHKVLRRLPMVTHSGLNFEEMGSRLATIYRLDGRATAHLLALQAFDLELVKLGELRPSVLAVQGITGIGEDEAHSALREERCIAGPLTPPQARWLRWELGRLGTETMMVMR